MSMQSKQRLVSVLVLLAMVFSAFLVAAGPSRAASVSLDASASSDGFQPPATQGTEDANDLNTLGLSKIDSELREVARNPSKDIVAITLAGVNMREARSVLAAYGVQLNVVDADSLDAPVAIRPVPAGGRYFQDRGIIVASTFRVPEAALMPLAQLASTIAITQAPTIQRYDSTILPDEAAAFQEARKHLGEILGIPKGMQPAAGSLPTPADWGAVNVHRATDAWAAGYTGSGVNVMVYDSGTDFAHPNLLYKWAVVNDPASPWDGWPIMFDAGSMGNWLGNFQIGYPPYPLGYSFGEASWYSDTSYESYLSATPVSVTIDGDPSDWTAASLVATDPDDLLLGDYDLEDLYVGTTRQALALPGVVYDTYGWAFAFKADVTPIIGNTTYVLYGNWKGTQSAAEMIYDNNFPITNEVVIPSTLWQTTATLPLASLPNVDVVGNLRMWLGGTELVSGVDFVLTDAAAGTVTFTESLYPLLPLTASYTWGFNDVTAMSLSFVNVDTTTVDIQVNGVSLTPVVDFFVDAMGFVLLASPLAAGDVVDAFYDYEWGGSYDPMGYAVDAAAGSFPDGVIAWAPNAGGEPMVFGWNGADWDGPFALGSDIGGLFAYDPLAGYIELYIPQSKDETEDWLDGILWTAGADAGTHAQDTVASDPAVAFATPDWTTATTTLSSFTFVQGAFLPYLHGWNGQGTKRINPDGHGGCPSGDRINRLHFVDPAIQPSASGIYRVGTHPDDTLTGVYCERIGVLFADENVAGVYDTAYVDLDNDGNFADEKPVTKADPISYADWIDEGNPFDSGDDTYNFAAWNGGDGIPDVSGGLVYFMPTTTNTIVGEVVIASAAGGETTATLANPWVAVDVYAGWWYGEEVYLNGGLLTSDLQGGADYSIDYATGAIAFFNPLSAGDQVTANYMTGIPLPYSPTYALDNGENLAIPVSGDIVLFYGDFEGSHGTSTTGAAGGNPVGIYFGIVDIYGTAPDAPIIGSTNRVGFDPATTWLFAGQGYDGVPGTGDEAQIVSNSYGISGTSFQANGWDFWSRYIQYLTQVVHPETSFLFAAGNEGWGYGTLLPPGSSAGVITVGAGVLMNYRVLLGPADFGPIGNWPFLTPPNASFGPYGDINRYSSRGPNALGQAKPDFYAAGENVIIAVPLNLATLAFGLGGGQQAWGLAGGTSYAAPEAAGVGALVEQAYWGANGAWPTQEELRVLLKSGADDTKFDPLQTGAGWLNALRSVELASDTAGVSVDTPQWMPGGYPTVADSRPGFVNLLRPGEVDMQTVTVQNHDTVNPAAVTVRDTVYERFDTYSYTQMRTGLQYATFTPTALYTGVGGGWTLVDTFDKTASWNTADFIKVVATVDEFDRILANGDLFDFFLQGFIWSDVNSNGRYDGVTERNRINLDYSGANNNRLNMYFYDPAVRINDGLVNNLYDGLVIAVADFEGDVPYPVDVTIEFYRKADASFLSVAPTSLNLAAGGTATFGITATGPALPGLYEASVQVMNGADTTTIPVVITVPATTLPANLGGMAAATSLYENGAINGRAGRQYTLGGDLRWFYLDVTTDTSKDYWKMLYQANWNSPADIEMFVGASIGADQWSTMDPSIWGDFTMGIIEESAAAYRATGTTSRTQEFLATAMQSGLLFVVLESIATGGTGSNDAFTLDVGHMSTSPTAVRTASNSLAGSRPVRVSATVPLYGGLATAVTEATETTTTGLVVDNYPFPGGSFITYLLNAPNRYVNVLQPGIIAISWTFLFYSPAADVDFGVFQDLDCDGVYDESNSYISTAASTGANPESSGTFFFPPAGCYWTHAAGYEVGGTGTFDETIAITAFGVSAFFPANAPTTTVAPFTPTGFDLSWDFLGSTPEGLQSGLLFVSPGYAQFALVQPIQIGFWYDRTAPAFSGLSPVPDEAISDAWAPVLANAVETQEDKTNSADQAGDLIFELDRFSGKMWVDGVDVTQQAQIVPLFITGLPDPPYTLGYDLVAFIYEPSSPWTDGAHSAIVSIADVAGNPVMTSWTWWVDTTPPALDVTSPAGDGFQPTASLAVEGTTEPGATVTVQGSPVAVGVDGSFSTTFTLQPGANAVEVKAMDALGSTASVTRTIVLDTTAPAVSGLRSSTGTLTRDSRTTISGVAGETLGGLWINGNPVSWNADGTFSMDASLSEGANVFDVTAADLAGNTGTASLTVTRDTTPPSITLTAPARPYRTDINDVTATISGSVSGGAILTTVNGRSVGADGAFSSDFQLGLGANVFVVEAVDAAGNRATATTTVTFAPVAEQIQRNYTAVYMIAVAIVLLVVGFSVGWWISGRRGAGAVEAPPEAAPEMPAEPEAGAPEELPAEEEMTTEEDEL